MDSNISFWFASSTFLFMITFFLVKKRHSRKQLVPPMPPGWPIIGNIFDLGRHPHQSLMKLKPKYGDLLWLKLGWNNTLVIQTVKATEQLFKNHDASLCDRKVPEAWTAHDFSKASVYMGRYGTNWRNIRRLVILGCMTNKKIQETVSIREKCVNNMIQFIHEDSTEARHRGESGEIEFGQYLFVMTFNIIGNLVLSRDLVNSQSEEGHDYLHALETIMGLGGTPNFADYFPILKMLDPQRLKKNFEKHLGRMLSIIEKYVMERIEDRKLKKERDSKDFLDTVLDYTESGDSRKEKQETIIHNVLIIIVEMFIGGTETTSGSAEWVLTELFRSPESMSKVKEELNRVVGLKRKVKESDIEHLPYLQAVVKETMRLHPVTPFLLPRMALEDTNFMGYSIPKGTQILINTYAIARDPENWEDPLSFKPERFIGSNIGYKGQNCTFLPFGAGRRNCAGYPLARQMLHLSVASLLHDFDWEIDGKSVAGAMDVTEGVAVTIKKLIPLKAIPKKKIIA